MVVRRSLVALALIFSAAACVDISAPAGSGVERSLAQMTSGDPPIHVLRQARTAPKLRAYRVAFWARRGTQTTVGVDYGLAPGQTQSDPFLRFRIPINGLVAGGGGVPIDRGDSVLIT